MATTKSHPGKRASVRNSSGTSMWSVRFVHKVSPRDSDRMAPVRIPDGAWSDTRKLGAALRAVGVLGKGARVKSFRAEGDSVAVFPAMPGLTTYWHSIILKHV